MWKSRSCRDERKSPARPADTLATMRARTSSAVVIVLAMTGLSMPQKFVSVAAQGSAPKLAAKAQTKSWTPPRTSWGDPDLEGVWTSDAAAGIPMVRPSHFAGRAELTDDEFRQKVEWDARSRTGGENAVGAFRGDFAWLNKSFRQTSLIIEPADGTMPPFTAEAQKRATPRDAGTFGVGPFDSIDDFTLLERCITRGIVGSILPAAYGNGNRILQTPGQVVISYEMVHDTRIIPLDGRRHIGQKIRQYLGDARGHWEGNTLVVETTNLTDRTSIGRSGSGPRHSADMKLIERFTRIEADVLQYEVTIDDPKTYTRPWKISIPLTSPPGFRLLPYECHEGNYMPAGVLSAERTEDKALEEDAQKGVIRARKPVQGLSVGGGPLGEEGSVCRGGVLKEFPLPGAGADR
jgi:hypothetical protein